MIRPRLAQPTPPGQRLHRGLELEQKALDWYRSQFPQARLVVRGFRCRGGELDAVLEEPGSGGGLILVLMEIRSRRTQPQWQSGLEAVDPGKRRRLNRAAQVFIASYRGSAREVRWDIIYFNGVEFTHFADAWRNT